mmetsp:Transcript_17357/g.53935  ORF Transcript_17357/g.53935 Transcript_17357/m.53935 type:complete len:208 (-) Transcript_17357:7-630(-)
MTAGGGNGSCKQPRETHDLKEASDSKVSRTRPDPFPLEGRTGDKVGCSSVKIVHLSSSASSCAAASVGIRTAPFLLYLQRLDSTDAFAVATSLRACRATCCATASTSGICASNSAAARSRLKAVAYSWLATWSVSPVRLQAWKGWSKGRRVTLSKRSTRTCWLSCACVHLRQHKSGYHTVTPANVPCSSVGQPEISIVCLPVRHTLL